MKKTRKHYSKDFKREAVRLMNESDKTHTQLARELGLNVSLLYRWRDQWEAHAEHAFPGVGHQLPEAEELTRLKRENARLKEDNDFLRKAAAYFAKGSP